MACLACCGSDLVDDQRLFTYVGELRLNVLSKDGAIAFFAKDAETLVRGLTYVGKHTKGKPMAYTLQTGDRTGIAIWAGEWHRGGELRYANKFTAGVTAVGFNILEFGKRKLAELILMLETLDSKDIKKLDSELYYAMHKRSKEELKETFNIDGRYTSIKDIMSAVGRDGRMVRNGAFAYVCRTVDMPTNINCGSVMRQIPNFVTVGELATKTNSLFKGPKLQAGNRDGGIF